MDKWHFIINAKRYVYIQWYMSRNQQKATCFYVCVFKMCQNSHIKVVHFSHLTSLIKKNANLAFHTSNKTLFNPPPRFSGPNSKCWHLTRLKHLCWRQHFIILYRQVNHWNPLFREENHSYSRGNVKPNGCILNKSFSLNDFSFFSLVLKSSL